MTLRWDAETVKSASGALMHFDLPLADLERYESTQRDPEDFEAFWTDTLESARAIPLDMTLEEVESPLTTVRVYDLRFSGFDGTRVRGWVRVPADHSVGAAVIQFHGYGRGRGEPVENLLWASAGLVHVEVDTRGQGWATSRGSTPDVSERSGSTPGFVTLGIHDRATYYYRRVFTDAVRAVDAARAMALVDPARIGVYGISQGGASALAAAALVPDVRAVAVRVPFMTDIPRAVRVTDAAPYAELSAYFSHYRDSVQEIERDVLPYFDGINFARRSTAPAVIVAALMDRVCPPSTTFAVHRAYAGRKHLVVREFNGHEAGGVEDELLAIEHLRTELRHDGSPPESRITAGPSAGISH
jgi:cephalosporin-C deacetylase